MSLSLMFQRLVGAFILLEALVLPLISLWAWAWGEGFYHLGFVAAGVVYFFFAFHLFDTGYPEERGSDFVLFALLATVVSTNVALFNLMLFTEEWSASETSDFVVSALWEFGVSLASLLAVQLRVRETRQAKRRHSQRDARFAPARPLN